MNSKTLIRFTAVFCIATLLVSCAAPGGSKVSQARQEFKTRTTYIQGIGLGALGGAALGTLQGIRFDRNGVRFDEKRAINGAIVGGVGGGIVGGIYAHHKVQEREQARKAEAALDEAIAQAKSTRKATSQFNNVLAAELRNLKAGDARLQGTINDANAVLRSVNSELNSKRQVLQSARAQGISSSERAQLQSQINGLEAERVQLENYLDRLAKKAKSSAITAR